MKKIILPLILSLVIIACAKEDPIEMVQADQELNQLLEQASNGFGKRFFQLPASNDFNNIPQDPSNRITASKVALGKLIFHETGFALNALREQGMKTYSCATCHHAGGGFQANVPQGISDGGIGYGNNGSGRRIDPNYAPNQVDVQPIRTPSVLNSAFQEVMMWNGQFGANGPNQGTSNQWTAGTGLATNQLGYDGVETQAIAGLEAHRFVINETTIKDLGYQAMFDAAFPEIAPSERYQREFAGLAVAAYERTVLANQAPFQAWLRGNTGALTDRQKAGATVFFGKAGCVSCHTGPALNSMAFHAIGMNDLDDGPALIQDAAAAQTANLGRGGFTGNSADNYKFKVPQIYNLKNSLFLGHGSSIRSVEQMMRYYNRGRPMNPAVPREQLAPQFVPLNLTNDEIASLTDFVENGLYDPQLNRYEPAAVNSGNCIPNNDGRSKRDLNCD